MDKNKILILGATIRFADVYTPRAFPDTSSVKYGIAFDLTGQQAAELERVGVFARAKSGLFNASSSYGPTIIATDGDYASIREAFDICDLRNISRDVLLKDVVADIACCVFEYNTNGYSGIGLGVDRIALEGRPLLHTARTYKASMENYT